MINLDEAITHCEEVAEANESQSKWLIYKIQNTEYNEYYKKKYQSCIKHASEHRQLAEWLRELRKWRALRDSINMLCDVDCEYPLYRESKTMCDACPIGTVKEYFEQIFDEEVNADE